MPEKKKSANRREFLEVSAATLTGLTFSPITQFSAAPTSQAANAAGRGTADLRSLTITEAAKRIASKQLSPVELTRETGPLDVMLDPTMPSPADVPANGAESFRNWFDLNGFPAVSVPCGFSTNPRSLPIGLQISAKPFQDSLALAVAYAYESATEWHKRRPAL